MTSTIATGEVNIKFSFSKQHSYALDYLGIPLYLQEVDEAVCLQCCPTHLVDVMVYQTQLNKYRSPIVYITLAY